MRAHRFCLILLGLLALALPAHAATLLHLDLEQMTARADRIYRGTVVDVAKGTVRAGGGELPTVTYRVRVRESLKGTFPEAKGGQTLVEVRMVTELRTKDAAGSVRRLPLLRDLPRLEVGREYLLLTTRPSAIGLQTTVGLGQGLFELRKEGADDIAVNAFNNAGLLPAPAAGARVAAAKPARGPIAYRELAERIRALVRR